MRCKSPVEDVEKITCNGFSVFRDLTLVDATLQRDHEFVAVLFNDKSDELLASLVTKPWNDVTERIFHLSHVKICLHDQIWIQRVRARCLGVIEKVFDFCERRLPKASTAVFSLEVVVLVSLL